MQLKLVRIVISSNNINSSNIKMASDAASESTMQTSKSLSVLSHHSTAQAPNTVAPRATPRGHEGLSEAGALFRLEVVTEGEVEDCVPLPSLGVATGVEGS